MKKEDLENKDNKTSPKHFFLHFFVILMLYFFVINLITLIFQSINILIPDTIPRAVSSYASRESIRFSLAFVIVVFPFFLISSFFLQKNYKENNFVEKMKIRKWLIYFTSFVIVSVAVFNLVAVVYLFLKGEVTLRFILKSISLLIILGLVFTYYTRDIRNKISLKERKNWLMGAIIIFFIFVILGIFLAGSPQKERLRRFDNQKINDLSQIERQVVSYYQKKGHLPEKLSDLESGMSGFRIPLDLQTKEPYEYQINSEDSFELCANFNLSSKETKEEVPFYGVRGNFEYEEGRWCFDRTIDREIYKGITPREVENF